MSAPESAPNCYFREEQRLFSFEGPYRGRCQAEVRRGGTRGRCYRGGHYLGLCHQHAGPYRDLIAKARSERDLAAEYVLIAVADNGGASPEWADKLRKANARLLSLVLQTAHLRVVSS